MKNKKKLGAIAAAIVVASQMNLSAAQANPTPEDARLVAQMLEAGEYLALRNYIAANPEIIEGSSALAVALAEFYTQVSSIDATGVIRIERATIETAFEIASIY